MKHPSRNAVREKRYYFHVFDGRKWFSDRLGVEVTPRQTLTDVVYEHIRDIRVSQANEVEWGRWIISVDDAENQTVLRVNFNFELLG